MGLDVPHESVGRDGAASWKHVVSGSFERIGKRRPPATIDGEGFAVILHQVRHPLKVIASMQTFGISTWTFMAQHIELDPKAPKAVKAMQAWVGWNRLIETKAKWRFQIEALDAVFPEFCRRVGVAPQPLPEVPPEARDSRTRRYRPLDWRDLVDADAGLAEATRALALEYGYSDLAQGPVLDRHRDWRFWRR